MSTQELTVSPETITLVIQQYFAATQGNNKAEAMVACLAEDCVTREPAEGPDLNGPAEARQFFQTTIDLFTSVALTEEFISINGCEAAVKWTGRGIGKNGCEVMFEGIDLFEFNLEGKIKSLRAYWNPGTMLAQLQEVS